MKLLSNFLLSAAVSGIFAGLSAVYGDTITVSSTAPTPGADDQYYLPSTTVSNTLPGNNYVATDQYSVLQSFHTGTNLLGYGINSFTFEADNTGSGGSGFTNLTNGTQFQLNLGKVDSSGVLSGVSSTYIVTYSGPTVGNDGSKPYITLDLSGAGFGTLSANTTYFVQMAGYSGGYAGVNGTGGAQTSTQQEYYVLPGVGPGALDGNGATASQNNGVIVFDASLTAVGSVPEPSTWVITAAGLVVLGFSFRRRLQG